jgi:hypothetical protein
VLGRAATGVPRAGDAHSNQEIGRRADYEVLFRDASKDTVRLETTPFYLNMRGARRRIAEELPEVRGVLVEAAWSASRAPGPLRAFYQRIQARRGFQTAVVATARKLTVLAWHLITRDQDYAFARPSLVTHKRRKLELTAGAPSRRGNHRLPGLHTTTSNGAATRGKSPSKLNAPTRSSSPTGNPPSRAAPEHQLDADIRSGTGFVHLCRSAGAVIGDPATVRIGTSKVQVRIAAILPERLSTNQQILLPQDLVPADVVATAPTDILVQVRWQNELDDVQAAAESYGKVTSVDTWITATAETLQRTSNATLVVLLALAGLYTVMAVVNAIAIAGTGRRREHAVARLSGLTRAQVVATTALEATVTTITGPPPGADRRRERHLWDRAWRPPQCRLHRCRDPLDTAHRYDAGLPRNRSRDISPRGVAGHPHQSHQRRRRQGIDPPAPLRPGCGTRPGAGRHRRRPPAPGGRPRRSALRAWSSVACPSCVRW